MNPDDYAALIHGEPGGELLRGGALYHFSNDGYGPAQPLLELVRRLVAECAVGDLETLHRELCPLHEVLGEGNSDRPDAESVPPPFRAGEAAAAGALRALAGLGLLLADDRPGDAELRAALTWYGAIAHTCAAPPPGPGAADGWAASATRAAEPLGRRLRQLDGIVAETGAAGPAAACAEILRHLAPPATGRRARAVFWARRVAYHLGFHRVHTVRVVFSHHKNVEAPARLRMRRRRGPDALVPHPEHMAFFCADEAFGEALRLAWRAAGRKRLGTVLWSLEGTNGTPPRITGGSLGAALAVVLDEFGRRRRWWVLLAVRRLRSGTAITGALDDAGALVSVSGYENKLATMDETGRLIVPSDDVGTAKRHAPAADMEILGAGDWRDAARKARALSVRAVIIRSVAAAAVAALVIVGLVVNAANNDSKRQRLASTVAELASEAADASAVDPSLPPLLALAAYQLDPRSPVATDALYRVVQDNAAVARNVDTHHDAVTALAGGGTLYAATRDGTLSAWDESQGRRVAERSLDGRTITAIEVNEAAPLVVTADSEGGVRLWRTDGAERLTESAVLAADGPPGAQVGTTTTDPVVGLGFTGADRVWALAGSGELRVWDTVTHERLLTRSAEDMLGATAGGDDPAFVAVTALGGVWGNVSLRTAPRTANALAATASGEILAVDAVHGRVTPFLSLPELGSSITALALRSASPDGILAVGTDHGVQLWNARERRQLPTDGGGPDPVTALAFDGSGEALAIGTSQGTRMIPVSLGEKPVKRAPLGRPVGGQVTVFAPDADPGGLLPVGHPDGTITFLDPRNRRVTQPAVPASTVAAFDGSGRLLVTDRLNSRNWITGLHVIKPAEGHVYDPETKATTYRTIRTLKPSPQWWPENQLFFVLDAALTDRLAIVGGQVWKDGSYQGMVAVWDARTGEPLRLFLFPGGQPDLVRSVRYLPGLSAIVARNGDGDVQAWSTRTWNEIAGLSPGAGDIFAAHPEKATAVFAATDEGGDGGRRQSLVFTDMKTSKTRRMPVKYFVSAMSFSPIRDYLAVLGSDDKVHFYGGDGAAHPGTPDITLRSSAKGIAIAPDGERIAVAMEDGDVLVYDVSTGTLTIPPLRDPDGLLPTRPAWEGPGDILATIGYRRSQRQSVIDSVQFWHTRKLSWRQQMCALAGRNITRSEWRQYVHGGYEYRSLCPDEE